MQPILFIDRDGVLLNEPTTDFQIDALQKFSFVPQALVALSKIATHFKYYTVLVSNQDGMGTHSFPAETFWPYQQLLVETLASVGFQFNEILIDTSLEQQQLPTRKPKTGLVKHLLNNPLFNLKKSFVIGDRLTDIQLAQNIGCQAIFLKGNHALSSANLEKYASTVALQANTWNEIYTYLSQDQRRITHRRVTQETAIDIMLSLSGSGVSSIQTGLGFFNHMLDQVAKHAVLDLQLNTVGDLEVDEHHTIEDTGIALGEAFTKALGDKRGIERYGFALPMDEAEAKVLLDFSGRSWLVWQVVFKREKVGDMPTEMIYHFFKSFADHAKCTLHIQCEGENEHHKIEAIFKAFAKAIKMAIHQDESSSNLPTTKGVL